MNIHSSVSSMESSPIVPENGTSESQSSILVSVPDDMLYEVVDGKIVEKILGVFEADIATLLIRFLAPFVAAHRLGRVLGETIFRIDQAKNLQRRPDVAFVSDARWPAHRKPPKVAVWDMVPDLAIEIVSPSNTADHVQEKIHEYFTAGVSRVWVVYPGQQEVYVYATATQVQIVPLGQDLDGGELVPGFRLPLTVLFEDEPE
jgi:Uma2 family endonuclease